MGHMGEAQFVGPRYTERLRLAFPAALTALMPGLFLERAS
jgi:hypothetical protein